MWVRIQDHQNIISKEIQSRLFLNKRMNILAMASCMFECALFELRGEPLHLNKSEISQQKKNKREIVVEKNCLQNQARYLIRTKWNRLKSQRNLY